MLTNYSNTSSSSSLSSNSPTQRLAKHVELLKAFMYLRYDTTNQNALDGFYPNPKRQVIARDTTYYAGYEF
jgi:hypothetical protein